ncbi:CBS domain-containing protein [Alienimonas californiensis]|uniref:CBS domain protein n=1 Tax=Alienimonas californiensis TaxID=2527989 RepID=A0A517P3N3_9PLAN|nr:CBS domain-containing protein [Alienimonas californiensis]QDT13982.1 CBS domain protein [Alienimonas californiensis]
MSDRTPDAVPPFGTPLSGAPWISVREVMSPPGPTLSAGTSLSLAVHAVLRENVDRIWLTTPDGRLAGQATNEALLRAELRGVPGERPLSALSEPVAPLDESSDAAAAVVRLGRGGETRLPVTRAGVLIGELTRNDVLALVHGVRRIASAAGVQPTPRPQTAAAPAAAPVEPVGPPAPRFLTRRAGVRADQARR